MNKTNTTWAYHESFLCAKERALTLTLTYRPDLPHDENIINSWRCCGTKSVWICIYSSRRSIKWSPAMWDWTRALFRSRKCNDNVISIVTKTKLQRTRGICQYSPRTNQVHNKINRSLIPCLPINRAGSMLYLSSGRAGKWAFVGGRRRTLTSMSYNNSPQCIWISYRYWVIQSNPTTPFPLRASNK